MPFLKTHVSKERIRGDNTKISAFHAGASKPRGLGAVQSDQSPTSQQEKVKGPRVVPRVVETVDQSIGIPS